MQLCRFSVCARTFETGRGAACPSCFDVPVEDLYSSRTDYEYCCQTCLDKDADAHKAHCGRRQVWRDVTRAGAVGEAIFGSWRESMFFMDITSASSNAHEWDLDLIVTHPYPGIPTFTNPRLSDEEYKAATSYESCTRATILLTNPLAWLLKGKSVRGEEVDVVPKKPGKVRARIYEPCPWGGLGAYRNWGPAPLHTVICLYPSDNQRGLVVDVTRGQYFGQVGTFSKWVYQIHHTVPPGWYARGFGYHLKERQERLADASSSHDPQAASLPVLLRDEASLRTINNTLYNEVVTRFSDQEHFLGLGHESFCQAVKEIEHAMTSSMQALRSECYLAMTSRNPREVVDGLEMVVATADARGHAKMMDEIRKTRVSGYKP